MALSDPKIPNASADVVGVFDQNFNQVFPGARPIKCLIDESAKAMQHPVETGTVITDHIIYEPTEIEISVVLRGDEYRSVYQQISQIYRAATILSVQTRTTTYKNMFIYRLPQQQDPDMFSTVSMAIRLRERLQVASNVQALSPSQVADAADQSTINRGLQQPSQDYALPSPEEAWQAATGREFNGPLPLPGPPPNDESYENYNSKDLEVYDLNLEQVEQILEAK